MDPREFRLVMKHYFFKGKTTQETKSELEKYYGESAPSTRTVYKWFGYFHSGHMSTNNADHSGRPAEVTTVENTDKIHGMVRRTDN